MQAFLALLMIEKVWGGDNLERYQLFQQSSDTKLCS